MDVANFLSLSSVASVRDDSDDEEIITAVGGAIAFVSAYQQSQHVSDDMDQNGCQRRKNHRGSLFRSSRRKFDYMRAHNAITLDYLHPNAVYGVEFKLIFRISRTRFEQMMTEVMTRDGLQFYQDLRGRQGVTSCSLEGMLLYPLKTLAFGVPYSAFVDYFQISIQFGMKLCREFDRAIQALYMKDYLRIPDEVDLRNINELHRHVHGVDGMLGSLDCSHTIWKNCPKAWAGSYQGKENNPSIVLEGISDYHMFFWHASYGYAGTLNDKTIFDLSPFQECLLDGSFEDKELSSGVVPFTIAGEQFNKMYVLVDGIYMNFSRFVKGIKIPLTRSETRFTTWQEAARKDIERAFGNLKIMWKFVSRPIEIWNLNDIAGRMSTALILHNIVVSDRVMGDVNSRYNPAHRIDDLGDFETVNLQQTAPEVEVIVDHEIPQSVCDVVAVAGRWESLANEEEHSRLRTALMRKIIS
jgi:hypothetical protein